MAMGQVYRGFQPVGPNIIVRVWNFQNRLRKGFDPLGFAKGLGLTP
jgi:hypothetical protein